MPFPTKPSDHIDWTDGSPSKITEPSSGKKLLGWTAGERPAFQYMNWLFWQLNNWDEYFETVTDLLIAQAPSYDAVVDGTTYADLNAVMADVSIAQGSRILIAIALTVNTIQQLTKNNCVVDFKPGITWTNGTANTGLQISATGSRIRGGRLSGFTTGILIDSGSNYTLIGEFRFAGNTNDIVDNNETGTSYGLIPE